MDGLQGFQCASADELSEAAPVIDPFHVMRLAGDVLNSFRRQVQQKHAAAYR